MKPIKLTVNTNSGKYPILIGSNVVSKFAKLINQNSIDFKKCMLIIDKKVPKKMIKILKKNLKGKQLSIRFIEASEKNKNQKNVDLIINDLLKKNYSRSDCLIAVGGGIIGDIVGFAASIFKRGLKFINVPTTLLSQVDSSIGGKTGINSVYGKNLVGSFYQPKMVVSDTDFLESLPKRELICGYAEIFKHSLILNKNFYKYLEKNIFQILNLESPQIEKTIYESCKIKKKVVEQDEKETNIRKILNFGHTFAHAYEAALNYSKKLNHGEAVFLGIYSALKFSFKHKYLNQKDYSSILNHIKNSKLPFKLDNYFSNKDINKILHYMTRDKKNKSKMINLILLKKIGVASLNNEFSKNKIKLFFQKELFN